MKRSRFTEEQISGILREQGAGMKTADFCRRHGISQATFYKYKAKFGGMDVPDARKLKVLEDENTKLKKLLAETMLDNAMLKDVALKNGAPRRICWVPVTGTTAALNLSKPLGISTLESPSRGASCATECATALARLQEELSVDRGGTPPLQLRIDLSVSTMLSAMACQMGGEALHGGKRQHDQ
ncbi:Transposase [Labrenzia sp. THAF191b]|nr:Transposase [Labrenzia sp. THAF191b]QFT03639.1 Transposase [Labrenzia sp. THAF191a]QFT15181.1 Transposase [Labrenzia sp. THAF187b]